MTSPRGLALALVVIGLGWGLGAPLGKIMVGGDHAHLTLVVWDQALTLLLLAPVAALRRGRLPWHPVALRLYALVAVFGLLLPFFVVLAAAERVPAGVLALAIGLIPISALGFATAFGRERADLRRGLGLVLGLAAVAVLSLPGAGFAGKISLAGLLLALIAPLSYGLEGVRVDLHETEAISPFDITLGASLIALPVLLPAALLSGTPLLPQRPFGAPEAAVAIGAVLHVTGYIAYLWLIGRAGPVYAAQIAYVETAAGVGWSWLLLSETYPPVFWAALALLAGGLALVRPRAAGPPGLHP
jgi:drug/metabolite transporter (DMT)-like permease